MGTRTISSSAARLQFTDGASCKRWIESLPLTNAQSAQHSLLQQIALVRQAGLAPVELLRILETLREPVVYVQNQLAQKFTAKALPLETAEAALWTRVLGLWQELIDCYLACRNAHAQGDP